jgi:hypothetical protein
MQNSQGQEAARQEEISKAASKEIPRRYQGDTPVIEYDNLI